jgi:glutathione S-transferase
MELLIADKSYFVGEALSVADIALLPYTRLAHEGGFDLESRPSVRAWIARCERDLRLH